MKDKILAALKLRFAEFGISDAQLEKQAVKLAVTVTKEDAIENAVKAVQLNQFVQSEVDSRLTEANKKAVDNAKSEIIADAFKEKGLDSEGKPIEKPKPSEGDAPGWFKDYQKTQDKAIDDLKGQVEGGQKKQTQSTLKAKVIEGLEKAKVPSKHYTLIPIELNDPEKVSDKITEIVTNYQETTQQEINQNLRYEQPPKKEITLEKSDIDGYLDDKFPKKQTEK